MDRYLRAVNIIYGYSGGVKSSGDDLAKPKGVFHTVIATATTLVSSSFSWLLKRFGVVEVACLIECQHLQQQR